MINNIIIIYIEGYSDYHPKQEKYLFQAPASKRIWAKYFKKMGFKESLFVIIPKKFKNDKDKYYKILDKKISNFLSICEEDSNLEEKNKKFLYLLITGDHDEKNINELNGREKIAKEIFNKYNKNGIILPKILLPRNKKLKLEKIMSELIGEKIFKKELKKRTKSEYPTIPELMKFPKKELKEKDVINNLINSKHILFKKIANIKNKFLK